MDSIDIDLALQLGYITKRGRSSKNLQAIIPSLTDLTFEAHSPLIDAIRYTDPKVLKAAQDIIKLAHLLNSNITTEKLNAYAFHDLVTATCYRLLEIKPLNSSFCDMHPLADTIYLGLLSFMTTFLIHIGRQRHLRYKLLSCKLLSALQTPTFQAAIDPETHLWLLVIAGISVLDVDDYSWLKPRLTKVAEQFNRTDWDLRAAF